MKIQTQVVQNDTLVGLYEQQVASGEQVLLTALLARALGGINKDITLEVTITASDTTVCHIIDDLSQMAYIGDVALSLVALKDVHLTYEWVLRGGAEQVGRAVVAVCDAPGARIDVGCRCLTTGKQKVKLHAVQIHRASHTKSDVLIKGVAQDTSRITVDTLIHIVKGIANIDAAQMHKQILLDAGARATSDPKLEVLSDDVKCSHGSAIRYVEADQLFYLQSRGYSPREARSALIEAFLA